MERHDRAIAAISLQIRDFHRRQVPFRLYHGSTNSTQNRSVDPTKMVDTSGLNHVLHVDTESQTCLVEPNVPMDQLVEETLRYGLLPPIVMEFPGITVGGGFAGMAGESSGFKSGFFDTSINWFEAVMPDGEIVRASPSQRADLFYAAAGSLGTLCVTTMFEMQLISAKKLVELTYHPTGNIDNALAVMRRATQDTSNDFVDGIMFAADRGVIVTGKLVDDVARDIRIQRFSRARDPWFYLHVDRRTRSSTFPVVEATPITDYLFRYDRGAFWMGRYAFRYFLTPFNRITRWLLDPLAHTRVMYHALHVSGHSNQYMVQDLLLPADTAAEFVEHVTQNLNFWPIWLCPFNVTREIALHPRVSYDRSPTDSTHVNGSFVNVGVWGPGPTDYSRFVTVNRRLEGKVRELGGIKWLYAQAYYTEEEFWHIYDRDWYEDMRVKCGATYLPSVYDKVRLRPPRDPAASGTWKGWIEAKIWRMWPISGVYGVLKTLGSRDYLLKR